MATVKDILGCKGTVVYALPPQKTILDALKFMSQKGIGAVLVMEGDKMLGIYTERDFARRGPLVDNPLTTPLQKVMTQVIYYVSPEQSLEACLAQMSDKHIRHLPVLVSEKVVGMVSIGDVVKFMVQDQKELITGLENFILGRELMS